jgi:hypothetical protein
VPLLLFHHLSKMFAVIVGPVRFFSAIDAR